ncbi:hypothetical protein B0O99DRAFT_470808, partial [Bisporella sp. PMI_857]
MSGNKPGESNALLVQIPSVVFCVISPIVVGIRFWSRIRCRGNLGWDDWTILGSLIFSMIVSVALLTACDFGFGKHMKDLTPENKKLALKLFYVAQIFYKVNINMTKGSILLLYLRIFIQKPFRILCKVILGIIVAYGVASTTASIFQCTPIPRAWNRGLSGTCINLTQNWQVILSYCHVHRQLTPRRFANAGFSIATDLIILCLPMPVLYKLKLPINQKIALMVVFALGGFVVVTSTLRMTTLNHSSKTPDTTYQIESSLWTVVEENIGIICACLPMFRPFLSVICPKLFPARDGNS